MSRSCEWCREPISFLDAQTSTFNAAWHTGCWNQAAEQRAAYIAGCEHSQGFARRSLPGELSKGETGSDRSEVIPIMENAASETRARREVVEFPPNDPVPKFGYMGCDDCMEEALKQIAREKARKLVRIERIQGEIFPEVA